ncbi:hypothetical protein CC86DRAFT_34424 [Ophiobolus disseminans]|uniref:Zn(2)-C6 fungal-type domain-containing protein n=1 Tax=Ophiobolus disseminans TaxID=1469910 RepID=A0A6A6ZYZ9_9PLEO|nr:hypothetical protein CC86DRAFT_34424 [Ophiobolus disseminans]
MLGHQRTRRSGAKVKTGCKTCKIRRVKCDELRPHCRRCTSTGRQCDGYPSPKEEFQIQTWGSSQPCRLQSAISMLSGFGSGIRYLEFYHHCARPVLSSSFDREFWSRITLQMAYSEPAVRHALIALGYLHSTETGRMKDARAKSASLYESKTLLYHYNKSVRSLVDRIDEASYKPEIALVTCLLFVCMEYLRGNYHAAFTHLTGGFKILSGRTADIRQDSPFSSPSSTSEAPITGSNLYQSNLIDEELRPIFVRAMASAMMYGVNVDSTFGIPEPSLEVLRSLRLASIREAQLSAHELRNQSILMVRDLSRKILREEAILPEDLTNQAYMIQCQRAWHEALDNFTRTRQLSDADQVAVSELMTHYHAVHIWTACAADISQMPFDKHLEGFQSILRHAELALNSADLNITQSAARFTFEISLIPAVYFVGTRCRCPTTRRKAVALLARNPPREGMWDAEQHVIVTNRVIEMEEEELDPVTGWPVEQTRLWSSVIEANMDSKGGFWAHFLPSRWMHEKHPDGSQKLLQEFFVV